MDSSNRKFIVVTAIDVNKREVTKVTEVDNTWLLEVDVIINCLRTDNKLSSIKDVLASPFSQFEKCMPTSYVKLHTVKEIKLLAVIGEIKMI